MPELRLAFQPFPAQEAYFRRKINYPSARWDDLRHGDHAHGFMVAGLTRLDVLDDVRQAVQKAISEGETLEDFRKRFDAAVAGKWSGFTGDGTPKGRAWRTRIIYQTNLRTSYMAGRWETLKNFPYLRYQHNTLANPREDHKAWNGRIIATSDPWWDTHYPPNGWGCRCTVTGVSEARLRALRGDAGADGAPGFSERDEPPPEWAYHVGKQARSMAAAEQFGKKVMGLPPDWRKIALDDAQRRQVDWMADWPGFVADAASSHHSVGAATPVGFISDDVLQALAAPVERRHTTTPGLQPVSALLAMTDRQLVHAMREAKGEELPLILLTLQELQSWIYTPSTRVYRQASPDNLVYARPLDDGRFVAVYVRIDTQPARMPPDGRIASNWVITAAVRTPEQMADYALLKGGE